MRYRVCVGQAAAGEPLHLPAGPGAAPALPSPPLHRHRCRLVHLQEGELELDLAGGMNIHQGWERIFTWGGGGYEKALREREIGEKRKRRRKKKEKCKVKK